MKEDKTFVNNIIKIGQNKDENDKLVANSKQTDLWFHLANLPSCHVILESDNDNQATREMIIYAAQLTKQNTKYRDHSKIIVNYIQVKYVRRTEEPGLVVLRKKPKTITL